jgi:hypothetical protein
MSLSSYSLVFEREDRSRQSGLVASKTPSRAPWISARVFGSRPSQLGGAVLRRHGKVEILRHTPSSRGSASTGTHRSPASDIPLHVVVAFDRRPPGSSPGEACASFPSSIIMRLAASYHRPARSSRSPPYYRRSTWPVQTCVLIAGSRNTLVSLVLSQVSKTAD